MAKRGRCKIFISWANYTSELPSTTLCSEEGLRGEDMLYFSRLRGPSRQAWTWSRKKKWIRLHLPWPQAESILGQDLKDVAVLGAREREIMAVGWAVLSPSVRLPFFPLTEQEWESSRILPSRSVREKWSGPSFLSFPTGPRREHNTFRSQCPWFFFLPNTRYWFIWFYFYEVKQLNRILNTEKDRVLCHSINMWF